MNSVLLCISAVMCRECFSFLLHDMSKGFVRRNHCDLFCSFVKSCAFVGSWIWIEFAVLPRVCNIFVFLSETLSCD